MANIFFFCGTSSVGKTSKLNSLNTELYEPIRLSARDVRAKLGNPSWDSLDEDVELAKYHQEEILDSFTKDIIRIVDNHTVDKVLVFERSLWDVVAYSYAFECGENFVRSQIDEIYKFEANILENNFAQLVRFPIDRSFEYEAIPERPSERIRDRNDEFLEANWRKSLLSNHAMVISDAMFI